MKKTNTKNTITNTPGVNKNLVEGAELLVREIKAPADLLEFMFEGLYWLEEFEKELRHKPCTFSARSFF